MKRWLCGVLVASVALVLLVAQCGRPGKSVRRVRLPKYSAEELVRAESLQVLNAVPEGQVADDAEAQEIIVSFDDAMVELGAESAWADFPLLLKPDVPGRVHWLGTRILAFTPDTSLPTATEFEVRIPKGLKSLSGRRLKADYNFKFGTTRPQMTRSAPAGGARFVTRRQPILLVFNQVMDPVRARRYLRLTNGRGEVGLRVRAMTRRDTVHLATQYYWQRRAADFDYRTALVLEPRGGLRSNETYTLTLMKGLPARNGNLGLGRETTVRFSTLHDFRFAGLLPDGVVSPDGGLQFNFSNPVARKELVANLRFEPALEVPAEYREWDYGTGDSLVVLSLPLKPETDYKLVLNRKLKDRFGNRLNRDYSVHFRTGSYEPTMSMPTGLSVLEAQGKPFYPVTFMNTDSVQLALGRLDDDRMLDLLAGNRGGRPESLFSRLMTVRRVWKPEARRNLRTRRPIDLGEVLDGREFGFVGLRVGTYDRVTLRFSPSGTPLPHPKDTTRFNWHDAITQVTDLGITGKFSPENNLIMVTRLADAMPVPDARVEVRDAQRRVVWSGQTDARGLVETPGWQEYVPAGTADYDEEGYGMRPGLFVFAGTADGDRALLGSQWGTGIEPWDFNISFDWWSRPQTGQGFIFTEKGLYHAGDTVHLKGIIRDRSRGQWVRPKAETCSLEVRNPSGERLVGAQVAVTGFGALDYTLPLGADAASGGYEVRVRCGKQDFGTSFRIEAYRPAEFEVKVTGRKSAYIAGDKFEGTVFGKYLFGAGMAGAKASWTVDLGYYYFSAPEFPDYDFGAEQTPAEPMLAHGTGQLDGEGKLAIRAELDLKSRSQSMVLRASADVTGTNLREVSGGESFVVHRGEFYVGSKPKSTFMAAGEPLEFELISVDTGGRQTTGVPVQVELYRRDWQSVRKAGFGGRYQWISKPQDKLVAKKRITTGREPAAVKFNVKEPGSYVVKCAAKDRRRNPVRQDFTCYVSGYGKAGWEMRDDDRIELVRDRPSYKPGDKARILVKSPYDSCRALVTIERELVLDKFTTELRGNAPMIEIPVKPEYLPNVYVSVVLLKGRVQEFKSSKAQETKSSGVQEDAVDDDPAKPGFKIGYVELPVSPEAKRLNVHVAPARREYRPGEEVQVALEVKGHDGKGTPAEVTLAVVDLGVLKLIGYETPDPFAVFYQARPLAVNTAESRVHVLGQRSYGEKGEDAGGGGAERGATMREKFLETVLWLPSVTTDADGRARASFKLPDNLTTFKIMAVAHNEDRFGRGDSQFVVNQPLLMQGSLPMFVRDGDEFDAGVVVHNNTERKGRVTVNAGATGLALLGPTTRTVELGPRSNREVRFRYQVLTGTEAPVFSFEARMDNERDGLKLSIPRRNPVLTEAYAVYEQTEGMEEQTLALPKDARPGIGGVQMTLASSGLAGLQPSLKWLHEYPYDCLEQKLSKVLPFIIAEDLVNTFKLSTLTGDALRGYVNGVLRQVPKYQGADGGFYLWDNPRYGEPTSPYLSAYCLYVLARARQNGFPVDEAVVTKGIRYLAVRLAEPEDKWDVPYSPRCGLATRTFMAYVLSLLGDNVGGYLHSYYFRREELSLESRAHLLKAMAGQPGLQEPMAELVREFMVKVKYDGTKAHFADGAEQDYWIYGSDARTTAIILQALLEVQGRVPDAEKMLRWLLLERKSGRWRTTQENAHVFDALATYYRTYERETPEFTATVELGMKQALAATFSGRSLEIRERFIGLDSLKQLTRTDALPVKVGKQGTGRLYYGLRLSYAPGGVVKPKTEGLLVRKTLTTLDGKPVTRFKRGATYRVTLKVYAPQERLFVVLDDPLPAGFEVVNTNFATTSSQLMARLNRIRQAEGGRRWWGSFDHEAVYADRYTLFATELHEGAHTYVYLVRALTAGRFALPPTRVEEMYTPEVFGHTGSLVVDVK